MTPELLKIATELLTHPRSYVAEITSVVSHVLPDRFVVLYTLTHSRSNRMECRVAGVALREGAWTITFDMVV